MEKRRRRRRLLIALVPLAALGFGAASALSNINATLIALAEARAQQRAMQQITLALEEVMNQSLDYADFVDVHYDAEGEASMLSANTILMNRIASEAAGAAQENIDTLAGEGIEFDSAGINQTRHKISLEATASVRIVLPSGARTVTAHTSALMAESILVGDVPQSYIQVPETGDGLNFLA